MMAHSLSLPTRYQDPVVGQMTLSTLLPPRSDLRMSTMEVPRWRASIPTGVARIPSQDYYWSAAWQRAEKKALAEIRRGEGVSFDSFEDAIRWLQEE